MKRRQFIRIAGLSTEALVASSTAGFLFLDRHFTEPNSSLRILNFSSLKEAQFDIEKLQKIALSNPEKIEILGDWSLHQNIIHCAQSIEYSLTGYPEHKPELMKKTIGKWVFGKFDRQDYMKHDRNDPIPAATPIEKEGDLVQAFDRLQQSISNFLNHTNPYEPHFVYGKLGKLDYEKAHYLHLEDHLSGINYGSI